MTRLHPATRALVLLAGAGDTVTGLLLVAAPGVVLALLGVAAPPGDPLLLRWIGAFVGGVGVATLVPLLGALRPGRLAGTLLATATVRGAVALFLAAALAARLLPGAWATVAVVDAALAAAQLAAVRHDPELRDAR